MKMDSERGLITNPIFKPYFDWKLYGASISLLATNNDNKMELPRNL